MNHADTCSLTVFFFFRPSGHVLQMELVKTTETPRDYPHGSHPFELYLNGSPEERADILLCHPDVCGYIYVHDRIVTKAFFPKKVIFYDTKDEEDYDAKVIVAAMGSDGNVGRVDTLLRPHKRSIK